MLVERFTLLPDKVALLFSKAGAASDRRGDQQQAQPEPGAADGSGASLPGEPGCGGYPAGRRPHVLVELLGLISGETGQLSLQLSLLLRAEP